MNIDHEGRPLETEKGRMEFQVEKGGRGVRWYERVKWTSLKTREFCVATEYGSLIEGAGRKEVEINLEK